MRDDVRKVVECLKDPEIQFRAVIRLGEIGPAAAGAVPALIELFESSADNSMRADIMTAIAAIGPAGAISAVPWLIQQLRRDDFRTDAALALKDIGPAAFPAVGPLVDILLNGPSEFWFSTVFALGAIGPAAADAVEPLENALKSTSNASLRDAIKAALRQI
jgi:HEAT repeat protein